MPARAGRVCKRNRERRACVQVQPGAPVAPHTNTVLCGPCSACWSRHAALRPHYLIAAFLLLKNFITKQKQSILAIFPGSK